MPDELPPRLLEDAQAAIDYAAHVRKYHARRTPPGSKQRAADIALARQRLREAMRPLKSAIGGFMYGPQTDAAEANRKAIREASKAIQTERRKLWKLEQPANKKKKKGAA